MVKYIAIFVTGIIFGQVGFQGVARMLDKGVEQVKVQSQELAK